MKRILALFAVVFLLSGCSKDSSELSRAIVLRDQLLNGSGCHFITTVTADYGNQLYTFQMECSSDSAGVLSFCVISPETISGITGSITATEGKLTFDDKALMFDVLADDQITPVSAPMLLVRSLRGGYIKACGKADDGLYIQIDDSYADDALHLDIWTDSQDMPIRAEMLWNGKRVLSMTVENFTIL